MLTSIVRAIMFVIGLPIRLIWFLLGWRAEGNLPKLDKMVILAVPHTSNWDYALMIPFAFREGRRPQTTTKHTLFKPPLGWLLRLTGAFPIDRDHAMGVVGQLVETLDNADRMILMFTPEGTRGKTSHWKVGFYQTAVGANVPIILGYVDYKRKVMGVSDPLYPTGDLETDFEKIKAFYEANGYPRHPERWSDLALRERDIRRNKEELAQAENA